MIEPLSPQRLQAGDAYPSQVQHEIYQPRYMRMQRTGITPPSYPDFAVYMPKSFDGYIGDLCYVYEAGYFWESKAWREHYRMWGKTPGETMAETAGRAVVIDT